jgi:predicted permease
MLLNIPIPAAIDKTLTSLGRCSTPLIMVFLGMILYETGMGNMFKKDILKFSFLRLIAIPACVWLGCKLCHVDSFITGVSVLLAAMPAGSTTSVLAEQYKTDVEFAANVVVATTILSVALLPVWVMILNAF